MPQTLQCYKCGAQNVLGIRFCTFCGEKFIYRCPLCSTNIDPGSEYCSHCTAKLDWGIIDEQQLQNSSFQQAKPVRTTQGQVEEFEERRRERSQQRGMSPWLIAFIIIVILIVVLFVIDGVLKF